jgi:hypothetical protein
MNVAAILSFVQLAIAAAPGVKQVYEDGKALVQSLFEDSLITAAQQNALMTWADAHQAAVLAGEVPPEFTVE